MIREDQKIVDTDVLLSRLFVDTKHLLLIEKLLIDVHVSRKFIAFFLLVPSGIFGIHDAAAFLCFRLLQNDLGCGTMSDQYKMMLRFIVGHFLELLFLLMYDLDVYLMLEVHLGNIRMEINGMLNPLGWKD